MKAHLRGTAFESSEDNVTSFSIRGQKQEIGQTRGINTVIVDPDGSFKAKSTHDVFANASNWNNWANWVNSRAAEGDIVALASHDAIRSAPKDGVAATLLHSIRAEKVFATEDLSDEVKQLRSWFKHRTPYALIFVKGSEHCIERLEPYKGPNAHLIVLLHPLHVRGAARESTEGNEALVELDGETRNLTNQVGLNTVILDSQGFFKDHASHDVYSQKSKEWHAWAEWVEQKSTTGDIIAVGSNNAVWKAPKTGKAGSLLTRIGAKTAYELPNQSNVNARTPYALLFVIGDKHCLENKQPYRGPNAHIRTTLITEGSSLAISRPVLKFDGQTSVARDISVSETQFTVSIWFKTDEPNCGLFSVVDKGYSCDRHLYLKNGQVGARLWRDQKIISTTEQKFADGKWHRLTYVFGSGYNGQQIYVDGQLIVSGTKNQSDFDWRTGIYIGYSHDGGYFKGEIAEVSLWNIARSRRDIMAWRERVTGHEVGLQAVWYFDNGTGTQVTDYSRNLNHAVAKGNVQWGTSNDFPGEYMINPFPAAIEVCRSEGEMLAEPISIIAVPYTPETVEAIAKEDTSEEVLANLIAGGVFPQFPLFHRLKAAIINKGLKLTKDNLGDEFDDINSFAAEVLDVFNLKISDVKLQLIKGNPGMVGDPGMEIKLDGEKENELAVPQNTKVRVSGTVTFHDLPFELTADFFQRGKQPRFYYQIKSTKPLGFGTFLPSVPLLRALNIKGPTLVFTNSDVLYDEGFDSGVNEGVNFFGNIDVGKSSDDAMKFIGGVLGIEEIAIHAAIDTSGNFKKYVVEAAFQRDITFFDGFGFKLKFTRSDIAIEVSGQPLEPAVKLSNDIVVTLHEDGKDTNLVFTGGIKLETESVSGFFTMNGTGRSPQGELSGAVQNTGEWEEPFGIPGLTIRQLSLQLGGTYAAPWIDNVGVHGNLRLGNEDESVDGSMSVLVDTNDPDQFVLAGTAEQLTMLQIMSFMTPATFAAYQGLTQTTAGKKLRDTFNKIVDVKLSDVKVNIVPVACSIGGVHFRDEGVTIAGRLSLWGWESSAFVNVDTSDGLTVRLDMEPLNLYNVFKLEGAKDDPHPMLRMRVGPQVGPELYGSIKVYLLGISAEVHVDVNSDGFTFEFNQRFGSIVSTSLSCSYSGGNFGANGSINFDLDVDIPTPFGDIPLDVGFNAESSLRIGKDHGFYLNIKGSFRFWSKNLTFPELTINVTVNDFQAVFDAVVKQLKDNAVKVFKALFGTLAEWADAVKRGAVKFAGVVADVAKNVFNAGREEAAKAYKTIGKGAKEVARGLKNVYQATGKQCAKALKAAQYAAGEVADALDDVFHFGAEAVATALKAADYTLDEVGDAIESTFHLGAKGVAAALRGAGYAADAVGDFIGDAFGLGVTGVNYALRGGGYAAREVSGFFVKSFFATKGFTSSTVSTVTNTFDPRNWF